MTEYDYSPEAVERHQSKMRGIYDWVRETERATSPSSSPPRVSPTYFKPRSMPMAAPIPLQMHVPQPIPQSRPRTASSNDHHHGHHHHHPHRHHSSRSRDDGHTRPRSNSASSRRPPSRSRTYSYAIQASPVPMPYGGIPVAVPQPRRGATIPGYGNVQHSNAQYITYDPSRPVVINGNGQYSYSPVTPMPTQPRQPPLLKRLFTSLAWRPSARPQSAQLETRPAPGYAHHSRAKSRDGGRERERDRRRRRRNSLP
ncbi:hypothetical protein K488DRAFT_88191 [Vararia minispora EC-137]|uniref:Uncharacterized protein n=1 Tax=Vararia minispora EC-137 TaxID=1314806 RepID=A0ACB8QDW5_9AGAM|nr:hypothetical protein K488DRAFT_88191 [Vararia minispora EC-137]